MEVATSFHFWAHGLAESGVGGSLEWDGIFVLVSQLTEAEAMDEELASLLDWRWDSDSSGWRLMSILDGTSSFFRVPPTPSSPFFVSSFQAEIPKLAGASISHPRSALLQQQKLLRRRSSMKIQGLRKTDDGFFFVLQLRPIPQSYDSSIRNYFPSFQYPKTLRVL